MNYSFHPLAEIELNQAIDYYNECQFNLGKEFNKEVYSATQIILAFPEAWSHISKNTRRCLLYRFPYGIIYQILKDEILIIAVMQLNKKPNYWKNRK